MTRRASLGTPQLGMMTSQCLPCGPSRRHDEWIGWLSCSIKAAKGQWQGIRGKQPAACQQMARAKANRKGKGKWQPQMAMAMANGNGNGKRQIAMANGKWQMANGNGN